jgi:hypothetical protein
MILLTILGFTVVHGGRQQVEGWVGFSGIPSSAVCSSIGYSYPVSFSFPFALTTRHAVYQSICSPTLGTEHD